MKKVFNIVLTILILVSLSGCFDLIDDTDSNSSRYELVGELNMSVDYNSYFGYSVSIKGKLKNISSKEFTYVSVTFAIYDKDGNQIETALDNMNYLQSGSTWTFDATMLGWTDVQPKSCKLVNVQVW